jgi:uncharacterized lipoprotein YehR (DUF1307 family)
MKSVTIVSAALVMSALLVALPGCQKQEAPAEHAGNAEGCNPPPAQLRH